MSDKINKCPFCKIPCYNDHCPYYQDTLCGIKNEKNRLESYVEDLKKYIKKQENLGKKGGCVKIYIAQLVDLENTVVVGVYTSEDLAVKKLNKALDDLMEKNEDLGVYSIITEKYIDDVQDEDFI